MNLLRGKKYQSALIVALLMVVTACGGSNPDQAAGGGDGSGQVKLILGAYTTPREAYRELIPIFQQEWKEKTGQEVVFEESYQGSGAQSRAIVEGFEADIAAL